MLLNLLVAQLFGTRRTCCDINRNGWRINRSVPRSSRTPEDRLKGTRCNLGGTLTSRLLYSHLLAGNWLNLLYTCRTRIAAQNL